MQFPKVKIDPVNQRVFVGPDGPVVYNIPPEVKAIAENQEASIWQRSLTARRLALRGTIIDVPVDVWGWDPVKTIQLRRAYGYTWVPSALMDSVMVAPGISVPGVPSYNAEDAPYGAILVPPPGTLIGE